MKESFNENDMQNIADDCYRRKKQKKNLLIYAHYYIPDTASTGQILRELAEGMLGVWGKWMKHAKFIYNIQDFNLEQVLVVNYSRNKLITGAMMFFDKFSCHQSNLIITVGRDLVQTVHNRFKGKKIPNTVMINNWIDEKEIYPVESNHPKIATFKRKYWFVL